MFNNTLTNLEKKALLITLAHLSSEYTIHTYSAIYNKKTSAQADVFSFLFCKMCLSIIAPKGNTKSPKIPISFNPIYIDAKVARGEMPMNFPTIFGSITWRITVIIA